MCGEVEVYACEYCLCMRAVLLVLFLFMLSVLFVRCVLCVLLGGRLLIVTAYKIQLCKVIIVRRCVWINDKFKKRGSTGT